MGLATLPVPSLRPAGRHDGASPDTRPSSVRQEWRDTRGTLIATGGVQEGRYWMRWPAVGTFVFDGVHADVLVHADPSATPSGIEETFCRGVLPTVCLARGYEAFHASAVFVDGKILMFAAPSDHGKSTLAAAVARLHGSQWADDVVVWSMRDGCAVSVALPFPSRLDPDAHEAVLHLGPPRPAVHPGRVAAIAAVYIPQLPVDDVRPAVRRLSGPEAFRQLLTQAHSFELGAGDRLRTLLERVLQLTSQVPVFELTFPSGLQHLAATAAFIGRHAAALAAR